MSARPIFYHSAGDVLMRTGEGTAVVLDDQTSFEILDHLDALRWAAAEHGARALRADVMVRSFQLSRARILASRWGLAAEPIQRTA